MLSLGLRTGLLGGPYRPPRTRRGGFLACEMRGKVKVGGYADGPIPWPVKWGTRSLILCGDLVEAVKLESAIAVAHHWGVSTTTLKKWRGALGVEARTEGTHALMRRVAREHATPQRMRRITALSRTAGRRPKPASWRRMLAARVRRQLATRGHVNPWLRLWTPAEDGRLGTKPDAELAKAFGRSEGAIRSRRWALRIPLKRSVPLWTKREEKLLGTASDAEVARRLGRGERGVQLRRQTLGIPKFGGISRPRPWKPEEDALLGKLPDREVARRLGRPLNVVQVRRYWKGIANPLPIRAGWSAEEDELLSSLPAEQVRRLTGRTLSAIVHRRAALGIKNPAPKRRNWQPEEIALLGKVSDHKIACLLNCPVRKVKEKRGRLGIQAPDTYEPGLKYAARTL